MSVHEYSYADGIFDALCADLSVSHMGGKLLLFGLLVASLALVVATGGLE